MPHLRGMGILPMRISEKGKRDPLNARARRPHHNLLRIAAGLGLMALSLTGCGPSKAEMAVNRALNGYFTGNFDSASAELRPLALETNEDFVLNNLRLGSVALAAYHMDEAEAAFLRAYEVINSMGVNNGGRSLGAILVDERMKIWKGEPFERAMANFYLGLIYYMSRDYENARGAFENALFKLREYKDDDSRKEVDPDQYRDVETNFALGYVMLAKSWAHLDRPDLARANLDRAIQLDPGLSAYADGDAAFTANVTLVIDYGNGPKFHRSFDNAIAGFGPTPEQAGRPPLPQIIVDGRHVSTDGLARPTVDLLALAQDKRWQSIDTIRTVKTILGTGLMAAGAYQGLKREPDYGTAAALIAAGLLLKMSSQADVRQWEMLPRTTFVVPLHLAPGRHDITVNFPPGYASTYPQAQTWRNLVAPADGEAVYYFRMSPWIHGPFDWPPTPAPAPADALTPDARQTR